MQYASNRKIPLTIQQHLLEPRAQPIQGGTSNDATIPSRGALSLLQPQASNS